MQLIKEFMLLVLIGYAVMIVSLPGVWFVVWMTARTWSSAKYQAAQRHVKKVVKHGKEAI